MKTQLLKVGADPCKSADIKRIVGLLKEGAIIAVPTETVYGLAANAEDKKALKRLYTVKKRRGDKPFTIQIAKLSQLNGYADDIPFKLEFLLRMCWPGPLTIIINGKKGKVGIRMPDNKMTLSIIKEAGFPVAVTSANISGRPAAVSAKEVMKIFGGSIDLVVDGGEKAKGIESAVVDCTVSPYKILRKGSMSDSIERFLKLYG